MIAEARPHILPNSARVGGAVKHQRTFRKISSGEARRHTSAIRYRLAVPAQITAKALEYLIAEVSVTTTPAALREHQMTVDVVAVQLSLPSRLAAGLVARIAALGAAIDSGQLEQLVNSAALEGTLKSASQRQMEFLEEFGFGLGALVHSTSGWTSVGGGTSHADDVYAWGVGLQRAGGAAMAAGAVMAMGGVTGPAAAVTAGVGGIAWLWGTVMELAAVHIGGYNPNDPKSEYPDVPGLDSETAACLLLLLAAQLGGHLLSNVERAIEAGSGGHFGAPDQTESRLLFGFPKLDAHILALVRAAVEAGAGGHVTDPSPEDSNRVRYLDPGLLAIDPGWNPYAVSAAIAAAGDRLKLIDSLAGKIKVVSVQ